MESSLSTGTRDNGERTEPEATGEKPQRPARRRPSVLRLLVIVLSGVAIWLIAYQGQSWLLTPASETGEPDLAEKPLDEEAEKRFADLRSQMVERQLKGRDIKDRRVLEAMGRIPRHRFVPKRLHDAAYFDRPLPIGHKQTISQPYVVALMTQLAQVGPKDRALDIGTGSGYQAAVLAELCKEVYSIEIVKPLAEDAKKRLANLGYKNLEVKHGDGYQGWKEHAPFDVIIVAAAPDHIPKPLIEQLAVGGRLVIPVGEFAQNIEVVEKLPDGKIRRWKEIPVRFVPMTGEAREKK